MRTQKTDMTAYLAAYDVEWGPEGFCPGDVEVYRREMDCAVEKGVAYYSPVLHPWSLCRIDAGAQTVELLLSYAKTKGMPIMKFMQMCQRLGKEDRYG